MNINLNSKSKPYRFIGFIVSAMYLFAALPFGTVLIISSSSSYSIIIYYILAILFICYFLLFLLACRYAFYFSLLFIVIGIMNGIAWLILSETVWFLLAPLQWSLFFTVTMLVSIVLYYFRKWKQLDIHQVSNELEGKTILNDETYEYNLSSARSTTINYFKPLQKKKDTQNYLQKLQEYIAVFIAYLTPFLFGGAFALDRLDMNEIRLFICSFISYPIVLGMAYFILPGYCLLKIIYTLEYQSGQRVTIV